MIKFTNSILLTLIFTVLMKFLCAQNSTVVSIGGWVLTKGIPNYVKVGLPGIAADSIILTASHSKIEKIDNWQWYVTPDTAFGMETIVVTAIEKKKIVLVDSTVFRLQWIADPHAYAFVHTGDRDSTTKSLLVSVIGLTARAWNINEDVHYTVQTFTMRIEPYAPAYLSEGPYLTQEMKARILSANSGSRVVFYGITVRYPDGRIKVVDDISIILK